MCILCCLFVPSIIQCIPYNIRTWYYSCNFFRACPSFFGLAVVKCCPRMLDVLKPEQILNFLAVRLISFHIWIHYCTWYANEDCCLIVEVNIRFSFSRPTALTNHILRVEVGCLLEYRFELFTIRFWISFFKITKTVGVKTHWFRILNSKYATPSWVELLFLV